MKKIKFILLTILLVIPTIVKADAGAPMSHYKVRISNPNGAYIYDYKSSDEGYVKTEYKIEYDKVVTINTEMVISGETFGGYVCTNEDREHCGYINLSNTEGLTIDLNDYHSNYEKTFYVYDDTCLLSNGPSSSVYKKIGSETKLEKGYTFTTDYYDDLWAYIPEKKVWVYTYSYEFYKLSDNTYGTCVITKSDETFNLLTLEEVKIYDSPKNKDKVLGTIPANTKISASYYYYSQKLYPHYYVTYNGVTGFIAPNVDENDYVVRDVAHEESSTIKVIAAEGIPLYKEYNTNSEVIATIPQDTVLTSELSLYAHHGPMLYKVEYENQTGWVEWSYDKVESTSSPVAEAPEEPEEEPDVIIDDSPKTNPTLNQIITICSVIVAIVCITAMVTIILINKKKEKKNANKNTDNTD